MDHLLKRKLHLFSAWAGIYYILVMAVGLFIMHYLPWPGPGLAVNQIGEFYINNRTAVITGSILITIAALLFVPFVALLADYVQTFEGGRPGILTYTFLMGGYSNILFTFLPAFFWIVCAFRADRSYELIQAFSDFGFLLFIGSILIIIEMYWALAIAMFFDNSDKPVFPRWVGYYTIFSSIGLLPDQGIFFFHHGPFAFNGLISVWIPFFFFSIWFYVIVYFLRRHILTTMYNDPSDDTARFTGLSAFVGKDPHSLRST